MYMMNTMVVRKLLDGFKHLTYKIAQQIESMSTFRNLVWHEFEIITRMTGCSDQTSNSLIFVLWCHPWISNADTTQYSEDL